MWNTVISLFREYMGTGLIVIWFLITVIYLLVIEKRKHIRILFLYVPLIFLLLFFNPLFAKVLYAAVGDEIYYRILWLLPITVVTAYGAAMVYGCVKEKGKPVKAVCLAVCLACLIGVSGSYIYRNPYFKKAENLYHVPQSVVDICDAIEVEGREVMAAFPRELIQYVRQYSPVVCMPYGREAMENRWGASHEMYDVMEAEETDAGLLAQMAKSAACHYVILPEERKMLGNLEDYEYTVFGKMHGYVIYRDVSQQEWNF